VHVPKWIIISVLKSEADIEKLAGLTAETSALKREQTGLKAELGK
jgi:hypothetical protein